MLPRAIPLLVVLLALPPVARASVDEDVATLKGKGVEATGPALLAFVKKRTPSPEVSKRIAALIEQLGDDSQEVRDRASEALASLGAVARVQLANATASRDPEVKQRAARLLEKFGPAEAEAVVLPAAARVLAARKPAGALQALLALLPHVRKDVADEMADALAPLASEKGKPDPLAVKALASPSPPVRAAAGLALAGVADARPAVRKLLKDPSPAVRRRVAVALLRARDREAVPALVALVGVADAVEARAADEVLACLAGDKAPPAGSGEKARAAWEKWWKEAGPKLDLAKAALDDSLHWSVLGIQDRALGKTRLLVLGARGEVKHRVMTRAPACHATLSGRDRLLVCESRGKLVEMDFKGNVHWSFPLVNITSAHRLRDGRIFVAGLLDLVLLDKDRKVLVRYRHSSTDISSARAFDDGTFAAFLRPGKLLRFNKDGEQVGWPLALKVNSDGDPLIVNQGCHVLFRGDGSFILPDYNSSLVRSYDRKGKQLWSAPFAEPWSVAERPGGGLYVAPFSESRTLLELNADGKEVRRRKIDEGGAILFVTRR